jgi:hypothetical protein
VPEFTVPEPAERQVPPIEKQPAWRLMPLVAVVEPVRSVEVWIMEKVWKII